MKYICNIDKMREVYFLNGAEVEFQSVLLLTFSFADSFM
jgi:hypothetical protein